MQVKITPRPLNKYNSKSLFLFIINQLKTVGPLSHLGNFKLTNMKLENLWDQQWSVFSLREYKFKMGVQLLGRRFVLTTRRYSDKGTTKVISACEGICFPNRHELYAWIPLLWELGHVSRSVCPSPLSDDNSSRHTWSVLLLTNSFCPFVALFRTEIRLHIFSFFVYTAFYICV